MSRAHHRFLAEELADLSRRPSVRWWRKRALRELALVYAILALGTDDKEAE